MYLVINSFVLFFFFNDTATTEIYTLSLHDALPISGEGLRVRRSMADGVRRHGQGHGGRLGLGAAHRSEEHTSELQSQSNLVCRLLLEKKKKKSTRLSYMYARVRLDNCASGYLLRVR